VAVQDEVAVRRVGIEAHRALSQRLGQAGKARRQDPPQPIGLTRIHGAAHLTRIDNFALVMDRDLDALTEVGKAVEQLAWRPLPDEDGHPLGPQVFGCLGGEPEQGLPSHAEW